jgi:hypothetical protein
LLVLRNPILVADFVLRRSIEELTQAVLSDSVSPAICMNEDCNFTCEMEPDQDAGYCEECHTNSMHSALILAELI